MTGASLFNISITICIQDLDQKQTSNMRVMNLSLENTEQIMWLRIKYNIRAEQRSGLMKPQECLQVFHPPFADRCGVI